MNLVLEVPIHSMPPPTITVVSVARGMLRVPHNTPNASVAVGTLAKIVASLTVGLIVTESSEDVSHLVDVDFSLNGVVHIALLLVDCPLAVLEHRGVVPSPATQSGRQEEHGDSIESSFS